MTYSGDMNTFMAALVVFLTTLFGNPFGPADDVMAPASPFASYATVTAQVVEVIDGDTLDVRVNVSSEIVRVRYIGIDTPEPYRERIPECGSVAATKANKALLQAGEISLVPGRELFDAYGRLLAYVYVDTLFINETLIQDGFARTMMIAPNQDFSTRFKEIERDAERARKGNWDTCR